MADPYRVTTASTSRNPNSLECGSLRDRAGGTRKSTKQINFSRGVKGPRVHGLSNVAGTNTRGFDKADPEVGGVFLLWT